MTEIIAEIGVNWSSDISIAKDMILQSKRAGADFVKFQMFNNEVIKDSKYKDELSSMILDDELVAELYLCAKLNRIKFGVSTMYEEAFNTLNEADIVPDFIKIRHADRNNHEIAQRAVDYCLINDTKLIVSVEDFFMGSKLRYDTSIIYERYEFTNYMYCIPKYPSELSQIYKEYINSKYFSGYSNHYPSKYLPMIAITGNLKFVEVHVRRPLKGSNMLYNPGLQIDENISIDFDDLEDVCKFRDTLSKLRTR